MSISSTSSATVQERSTSGMTNSREICGSLMRPFWETERQKFNSSMLLDPHICHAERSGLLREAKQSESKHPFPACTKIDMKRNSHGTLDAVRTP